MTDAPQSAASAPPPGGTEPPGGTQPPRPSGSGHAPGPPSRTNNPTNNALQRTRSWTGLWVVVLGDAAIVIAAVWGIVKTSGATASGSPIVAILTSAFTAIGTMTTAYFGIRSATNTAQSWSPQGAAARPSGTPPGSDRA
jgi:hypothetical protein